MAPPDFARRMNYALETLYFFLNGRYSKVSSNDRSIRAYYLRCPGYPEDLCIAAPDRGVEPVGDR